MNKLPLFNLNECKQFKFTNQQYNNLEIEYNRYNIYKNLIKQIDKILGFTDSGDSSSSNRKKYENKNIIERFVLECINHGITPDIGNSINNSIIIKNISTNTSKNTSTNNDINNINDIKDINNINDIKDIKDINYDSLSKHLFFNKILEHSQILNNTHYYKKMISEYNEKKILLTPDKILNINKAFSNASNTFTKLCSTYTNTQQTHTNTHTNTHTIDLKFKSISCSITLQNSNFFIVKYRDYIKTISVKRYYKLLKNYDKPFPYDIIVMLLRYSLFDMSSQQWSIGDNLYDDISDIFNISFEMFASPLNFNMDMFCSIFYDTDHIFGSLGSFYGLTIDKFLNQNIKGVFFNPPYLPLLMNNSINKCLRILDDMNKISNDFTIISFLPNWDDAEYIKHFSSSKYTVVNKIVNKGNYLLHEKDKGKLINGTFDLLIIVLNSMKSSFTIEKKNEFIDGINKIVTIMKDEVSQKYKSISY